MYPITSAVAALFEAEQPQILRITGTDANGTPISITDDDIYIDGFNIDRYSCNGEKLEVGTAIAAEMTLKLINNGGIYDGIVFEGAELFVEIGIANWTQDTPTVNWIPCGYFTPDEQPRKLTTITLKALDRMTRFDALPPTLTPWTDNNGNVMTDNNGNILYFAAELSFPCTIAELVQQTAIRCSVPFSQNLSNLPNSGYIVTALPSLQQEITFRNIIQWCAGIMGTNAWIDWTGSLVFSWYGTNYGYVSSADKRFSSDIAENDIAITGVQYTNTQGITIVSGTADYAIDMTGNYLAAGGVATILPNLLNQFSGYTYRPFSASVINAPYVWPMDVITVIKDGVSYDCAITNVNFGINGTTELASKGETQQTNKATPPSGMTNEQAFLVEKALDGVVDKVEEALTQEEIFNRLTNNGEEQALILYNGKLYLNASYIRAGTVNADFIKGGTLTLGGNNNINGSITVKNADGNVIGTWDNTGIATEGSFTTTSNIDGTEYKAVLANGVLSLYEDGVLAATLDWGLMGAGLYSSKARNSRVTLSAITTNQSGELNGGSSVECWTDGEINLMGNLSIRPSWDSLPYECVSGTIDYVKDVNFDAGYAIYGSIEVVNGLIVDIN